MKKVFIVIACTLALFVSYKIGNHWLGEYRTKLALENARADQVRLQPLNLRWNDAVKIAQATGRIGLAKPIADLQAVRTELRNLKLVSVCMMDAKTIEATGMENFIDGMLAFSAQEGESTVQQRMGQYLKSTSEYHAKVTVCTGDASKPAS